jgi:ring-1,2-phenylacetyl-CoA epoxidase subunit PaaD
MVDVQLSLDDVTRLVSQIPDPEIPAVTLADLGILRSVTLEQDQLVVTLTPTYSGCPATEAIRTDVKALLLQNGFTNSLVKITLTPAWSSDWITSEGRRKLSNYGIAPPQAASSDSCLVTGGAPGSVLAFRAPTTGVKCPRCQSTKTQTISQFGSTPCKALYRCTSCLEPFDYFKPY